MPIAIQICSSAEWKATLNHFYKKEVDLTNAGIVKYFKTKINKKTCIIYYSRASKTFASAGCQYAIDKLKSKMIINIGTAGKVSDKLKASDIIVANKTIHYDIKMLFGSKEVKAKFDNEVTVEKMDLSKFGLNKIKQKIHLGTIASADHDLPKKKIKVLKIKGVLAADWESASISLVCRKNNIPCLIMRGISDVPSGTDTKEQEKQYQKNTKHIIPNAFNILNEILCF